MALLAILKVICRQVYYILSFGFIHRTPRSHKTYLKISNKFFIPNLIHYFCSYIKGCHICLPMRQLQAKINLNYRPLSRLSMHLKVMPGSDKGHKHILCIIDKIMNYLIAIPIYQSKSEEIGDALIKNVITKYCVPEYIIMDQDSMLMSSLMSYLLKKLDIKLITVAPCDMELSHYQLF